ncbi:hypothetical protein [Phenylobacterium montanum]|uniref:Ethyl tert-butyl ether degradation EthD n=1 Tax=Phenylobacterium montanum TaxID=2823693 RepID=A0A975G3Z2_9CAUL|nr:hypothetical protein [Caulobacter sp. S6]QUD90231.1 hypothetical protein KCG34_10390 [Caulobacter sp. S6]
MITRTAIFEGRIKPGYEERFFSEIQQRLAPLWKQFPEASNVRLLRVDKADDDALPIVMIQQIDYPSMKAVETALASDIRAKARVVTLEILEMFEGRFYHVMSEGNLVDQTLVGV